MATVILIVVLGKGLLFYILWGWIKRVNLVGDYVPYCSLACTLYESINKEIINK